MTARPDPSSVRDAAGFVQALRLLKVWAGNPSFNDLARRSGMPRSTLADAVRTDRPHLPRLDVVRTFVRACGIDPTLEWDDAWRQVESATSTHPLTNVVPRELPPDVVGFSGRADELAELDGVLSSSATPKIVAVCGTAGVGKTALAVHWAHRQTKHFPDRQLYVNLRGYDPGQPVEAADAAGMLLRSLVPAGATIPSDEHARISLLRSLTADRRLLILLDNASSPDQVRPLLAAGPGSLVIVTSRDTMSGLVARDGAHRVQLNVLSADESARFLSQPIGERASAEPDIVAKLARRCACLPLGLRLVAEFVATRPDATLADHLADLDAADTLDQLDAGGDEHTSLRAVFSWSYLRLPPEAARAFRLLGAHPGRDYDAYTLAALTDSSLTEARRLVRRLQRAHLLDETSAGRHTTHDLLYAYALDLAAHDTEATATLDRLLDHYIWCATAAHDVLYSYDTRWLPSIPIEAGTPVPELTSHESARAWFDANRQALVAAVHVASPRSALDLDRGGRPLLQRGRRLLGESRSPAVRVGCGTLDRRPRSRSTIRR